MRKNVPIIAIYSVAHFAVDFACAYLVYSTVGNMFSTAVSVLLYNFFAFAMQMPFGLLADKINKNALVASSGAILVAAACGIGALSGLASGNTATAVLSIAAAVIAGAGNGLFHVGGGIEVLNLSSDKIGALGLFVSPGAFGIYFGTILGRQKELPMIMVVLMLIIVVLIIAAPLQRRAKSDKISHGYTENVPVNIEKLSSKNVWLILVLLFVVVVLRSYTGLVMNFDWKSGILGFVTIAAVVFGKTAGGMLADIIGIRRTSILSLGLAAVFFAFSSNPICGIIAVFCFNMTMPLTLWLVAKVLPGAKGFTFGILTFALFIGFVPAYLGVDAGAGSNIFYILSSAVSLVLMLFALKACRKESITEPQNTGR